MMVIFSAHLISISTCDIHNRYSTTHVEIKCAEKVVGEICEIGCNNDNLYFGVARDYTCRGDLVFANVGPYITFVKNNFNADLRCTDSGCYEKLECTVLNSNSFNFNSNSIFCNVSVSVWFLAIKIKCPM